MKAFISYAHRDEAVLDRLHTHLAMLRREGAIDDWYDRDILAGGDIDQEIASQLESCELFLPLVSPDFLASDYCYETEMTRALERHNDGETRVVPIIVEPCDWTNSPLHRLKAIPKDGKPISEWTNDNAAYLNIVTELRRLIANSSEPDVVVTGGEGTQQNVTQRYRAERDFDEIDRSDFRDSSFNLIRNHFEKSIEEINTVSGLRGRYRDLGATSFGCTVINQNKERGIAHITVHALSESHGFGDISYSFSENASANTSNGWFSIDSDDYDLFLRSNSMRGFGQDEARVSKQSAAELLWKEFISHAGVSYE